MPSFFFYSDNAPDAKVVLNRGTLFTQDITKDIVSFNTSNDIGGMGSFTINLDNTNDKHIDRYGKCDLTVMSSIEIFVKTNIAQNKKTPKMTAPTSYLVQEGQSINSIIENEFNTYGFSSPDEAERSKSSYMSDFFKLNPALKDKNSSLFTTSASSTSIVLASGQYLRLPAVLTEYKRIFLGVVLNVSESFSAGSAMQITLTGESFGYWLKASTVNIHPSVQDLGSSTATQLSVTANKYAQSKALDIFKDLIKFSSNDTLTVQDFTLGALTNSFGNSTNTETNMVDDLGEVLIDPKTGKTLTLQMAFDNASLPPIVNGKGQPINKPKTNNINDLLSKLEDLRNSIKAGTLLDGTKASTVYDNLQNNSDGVSDSTSTSIENFNKLSSQYASSKATYDKDVIDSQAQIFQQQKILNGYNPDSKEPAAVKARETIDSINSNLTNEKNALDELNAQMGTNPIIAQEVSTVDILEEKLKKQQTLNTKKNSRKVLEDLGIMKHWQEIFSSIVLEVANATFLNSVYPFKMLLQSPSIMDGEYVTKADLAKQISDALMFEFYVDTNGHFVVKPPFYNIDIPKDDPTYIIEQEDITTMTINESTDGIITRIGVTGDIRFPPTLVREQTYNVHVDLNLINKYGIHSVELQNMIFLRTAQDCRDFGEAYMGKNNQELNSASVTVMGRPDIRLGVACYLKPRDTLYYIKGISHDFSVGSEYTTTLNLIAARKIVTGFKALSTVNTVTKTNIGGITIKELSSGGQTNLVEHYIPCNSTTLQSILATQSNSQYISDIGVVKNAYLIISHPNPGYVGMIVPQNSLILSSISTNAFDYILNSLNNATTIPTQSLKASYETLQTNFGKNPQPFEVIKTYFYNYANKLGIVIDNAGKVTSGNISLFTLDKLNDFFTSTLNSLSTNCESFRQNNQLNELQVYQAAGEYFNRMIIDAGVVGQYRQYTDSDGREYPVTLDYGKGLMVENAQLSLNPTTSSQIAKNTTSKTTSIVDDIISSAKQNLGSNVSPQINPPGNSTKQGN